MTTTATRASGSMRGVRLEAHGGLDVLEVRDWPKPEPGPGEVRVRVEACALNHLDLWVRRGLPGAPFHLPITPGSDVAGVLDALGPGTAPAKGLDVGTPVMVLPGTSCGVCAQCVSGRDHLCRSYGILGETRDGGMAEYVLVPRANVVARPARLSGADAAAMSLTFLTSWHMLVDRAELRGGETVLVQAGVSGVGAAAIQIARYLGARVIATAGSDEKVQRCLELGAHEALNYRTEDFVSRAKAFTGKRGIDVVFEHVGGETFEKSLRTLAWGGRLVTCGATTAPTAHINVRHVFFKSQSILGSTMGSKGEYHQLVALYGEGLFEPVIDRVLPFTTEGVREGHRVLEAREAVGKVVLDVAGLHTDSDA